MIYFTADLHLGHAKIIEYCNRPFKTVEEMNNTILTNWECTIKPTDTIYVLGDLMFNKNVDLERVKALPGHKRILRGNHDRGFTDTKLKSLGFEIVYRCPILLPWCKKFNVFIMHAPNQQVHGALNLCGHVHDSWKTKDGYYNVGVDVHNFTPVSLRTILTGGK